MLVCSIDPGRNTGIVVWSHGVPIESTTLRAHHGKPGTDFRPRYENLLTLLRRWGKGFEKRHGRWPDLAVVEETYWCANTNDLKNRGWAMRQLYYYAARVETWFAERCRVKIVRKGNVPKEAANECAEVWAGRCACNFKNQHERDALFIGVLAGLGDNHD